MLKTIKWTLKPMEVAADVQAAGYSIAVTDAATGEGQHKDVGPDVTQVDFDIRPGTWIISAVRLDANGQNLGPTGTDTITVEAPTTITVMVVDTVSVVDATQTVDVVDKVAA